MPNSLVELVALNHLTDISGGNPVEKGFELVRTEDTKFSSRALFEAKMGHGVRGVDRNLLKSRAQNELVGIVIEVVIPDSKGALATRGGFCRE